MGHHGAHGHDHAHGPDRSRDARALGAVLGLTALFALVEVTSVARRHLPRRVWRGVHHASYAFCWTATLHAATSGTDTVRPAIRWTMVAIVAAATAISVVRFARTPSPRASRVAPAG